MLVDVVRVCGVYQARAWANREDSVPIRFYRVPLDTPALPFAHRFLHPDWDDSNASGRDRYGLKGLSRTVQPGRPGMPVGVQVPKVRYDRGALQTGWRPPTHFIGTERQWTEGSIFPADQPLVWRGGWSTACRQLCQVERGEACATDCDVIEPLCPIWCLTGLESFAGLGEAVLTKKPGCMFNTHCVYTPAGATAAAWEVVLPEEFAGLTGAYLWGRPDGRLSSCCDGG